MISQMPKDGSGFLYHYQTLCSTLLLVLVGGTALLVPHIEHLISRRRAEQLIRFKSALIAANLLAVLNHSWFSPETTYWFGAIKIKETWLLSKELRGHYTLTIEDANALSRMEMELVEKIVKGINNIDSGVRKLSENPVIDHYNGFTCFLLNYRTTLHCAAKLSGEKKYLIAYHQIFDLIDKANEEYIRIETEKRRTQKPTPK